jgi:hypothetical protein
MNHVHGIYGIVFNRVVSQLTSNTGSRMPDSRLLVHAFLTNVVQISTFPILHLIIRRHFFGSTSSVVLTFVHQCPSMSANACRVQYHSLLYKHVVHQWRFPNNFIIAGISKDLSKRYPSITLARVVSWMVSRLLL